MNEILFYRPDEEYGFLSNFYLCRIVDKDNVFASAEHYFQWAKAVNDPQGRLAILNALTPTEAKRIGRNCVYDVDLWDSCKDCVMTAILYEKFSQNEDLGLKLMGTGNAQLVEAAPYDSYWGGTIPGSQNKLGEALEHVRNDLRASLVRL